MSYAPKKVFILENGKYVEISYEEHSKRKTNDPEYGEKYFILVDDILMEVSYENYKSYHQYNEHEKYVTKRDKKKGVMVVPDIPGLWQVKVDINSLNEDEQKAVQRLIRKIFQVLSYLGRKDREIIRAIYVERLTEKQLAERQGVRQQTIHMKKQRILKELKSIKELLKDE